MAVASEPSSPDRVSCVLPSLLRRINTERPQVSIDLGSSACPNRVRRLASSSITHTPLPKANNRRSGNARIWNKDGSPDVTCVALDRSSALATHKFEIVLVTIAANFVPSFVRLIAEL